MFPQRSRYFIGSSDPPSRNDILGLDGGLIHFQGLVVQTQQFGTLPGFEACIAWLNDSDRVSYWTAKKRVQDTHALIMLPFGPPLYDEPNQPYSADRFGPLDWTNNSTRIDDQFITLLRQTTSYFNRVLLFLGGDGANNYPIAFKHLELLSQCNEYYNSLYKYCVVIPGWDGVFYGWPLDKIQEFGSSFRSIWSDGYLGLEHGTGHIPLGEGTGDYSTTGRMKDYDLILSEYSQDLHQDSCWQINGRLENPYHRPSDQPQGDDPNPPYYFSSQSARGPFSHCAFEYGEFEFVRSGSSDQSVQLVDNNRAYQKAMGCRFVG